MTKPAKVKILNARQARFVQEYLVDLNATQAYIRAGYSAKTANVCGHQLLMNPSIAAAVKAAMAERSERVGVTVDHVLDEIAVVGFSSLWHYEIDETGHVALAKGAPESAIRSVSSIKRKRRVIPQGKDSSIVEYETEIRLWDKPSALRLAGQHLGMFVEKVEHSGPDGGPIEVNAVDLRDKLAGRIAGIAGRMTTPTVASNGNGNGNGRHG